MILVSADPCMLEIADKRRSCSADVAKAGVVPKHLIRNFSAFAAWYFRTSMCGFIAIAVAGPRAQATCMAARPAPEEPKVNTFSSGISSLRATLCTKRLRVEVQSYLAVPMYHPRVSSRSKKRVGSDTYKIEPGKLCGRSIF